MKKLFTLYALFLLSSMKLFGIDFSQKPIKLSAYYIAKKQSLSVVTRNLLHQKFQILATTSIFPNHTVLTITNRELQNTNSYLATLQVSVNPQDIRVQNPSYFGAAYLNKSYYYGKFSKTTMALEKALGTLHQAKEKLAFSELPNYTFQYGLPKRDDTRSIKRSPNLTKLFLKAETKKYVAYRLALPNGSILIGHKLHNKTNNFLKVIHKEANTQIFPYESMIQGNEASIMDPKYYLTLSLPTLTLEEFIQIASTPDEIYLNIKNAYEKAL